MPRLPKSMEVLESRDFRLLFGAQSVSVLGDRMVAVALAFAVLGVGGSPSAVGLPVAALVEWVAFAVLTASTLVLLAVPDTRRISRAQA